MNNKDFNLYVQYRRLQKEKHKLKKSTQRGILISLGVLLVAVAFGGYVFWQNMVVEKELTEINSYINNPDNIIKANEVNQLLDKASLLNGTIQEIESITQTFNEAPKFSQEVFKALKAKDYQANIEYGNGIIYLSMETSNSDTPRKYVEELKETGLFTDVKYYGFELADNGYTFNVEAYLIKEVINETVE